MMRTMFPSSHRTGIPAILIFLFALLVPEVSTAQGIEITDSTKKHEFIKHMNSRYFNYKSHNIRRMECSITNSLVEQVDHMARSSDTGGGLRSTIFELSARENGDVRINEPNLRGSRATPAGKRLSDVVNKSEKSLTLLFEGLWGFGCGRMSDELKGDYRLMEYPERYVLLVEESSQEISIETTKEYAITYIHATSRDGEASLRLGYFATDEGLLINKMVLEMGPILRHEFDIEYQDVQGIPVPVRITLAGPAAIDIFNAAGIPPADTGLVYLLGNYTFKIKE